MSGRIFSTKVRESVVKEIMESEFSEEPALDVFSETLCMECLVFIFRALIEGAIKSSPKMSGIMWVSGLFIVFWVCDGEIRCDHIRDIPLIDLPEACRWDHRMIPSRFSKSGEGAC